MSKTAIITGAARGIGRALATVFAANGYDLILGCKNCDDMGNTTIPVIKGDLKSKDTIDRIARKAKECNADLLINNAGIHSGETLDNMSAEDIRELIDVNLTAHIMLTKAVLPMFKDRRRGIIVNINSLASKQGGVNESVYSASKFGLRGFAQSLEYETAKYGIRVINVNLGAVKTDMTINREGWDKLIDPLEVADLIFSLCKEYTSLRATDIDIKRMRY